MQKERGSQGKLRFEQFLIIVALLIRNNLDGEKMTIFISGE